MRLLAFLPLVGLALFLPVYLTSGQMSAGSLISDYYLAGFIFIEITIFIIQLSYKPKPKISLTHHSNSSGCLSSKVRVSLDHSESEQWREAVFFLISVQNTGSKMADRLMPVVGIGKSSSETKIPVSIIHPTGNSLITATWKGSVEEFQALGADGLATALVQDGSLKRDSFSLYANGLPREFALLFTIKGSTKIYIPSENISAQEMPTSFQIRLFFQAKNLPLTLLQVFEVDAKSWDSVSLKQIPPRT